MSTPEHDVEYRLDADHIRAVCRAEQPDGSINVTQVDGSPYEPPYVDVHGLDFRHSANDVLRKVGYLTHLPNNRNTLVVTGWSTTQLAIRAAALAGLLARWRDTLTDTAARAVDIYALTRERWAPPGAHHYAVNSALFIQEHEARLVTGPHAAHDPYTRPHDDDQARLLADNQRLEQAVADHLDQARRVAGYAIDAYTHDLNAQALPADARAWAITAAMNRYSAEQRENPGRRTTSPVSPVSPVSIPRVPGTRSHPATVAANDQPTRTPTGEPAEPIPPASATAADAPGTADTPSTTSTVSSPRGRTP